MRKKQRQQERILNEVMMRLNAGSHDQMAAADLARIAHAKVS
jgi:hypothetical protein